MYAMSSASCSQNAVQSCYSVLLSIFTYEKSVLMGPQSGVLVAWYIELVGKTDALTLFESNNG